MPLQHRRSANAFLTQREHAPYEPLSQPVGNDALPTTVLIVVRRATPLGDQAIVCIAADLPTRDMALHVPHTGTDLLPAHLMDLTKHIDPALVT